MGANSGRSCSSVAPGRSLAAGARDPGHAAVGAAGGPPRAAAMTLLRGINAPGRRGYRPRVRAGAACFHSQLCSGFLLAVVSEREVRNVTREVGHLLAFANSGERKDAHSRGPSNLKKSSALLKNQAA